jgi:hypothetical protein
MTCTDEFAAGATPATGVSRTIVNKITKSAKHETTRCARFTAKVRAAAGVASVGRRPQAGGLWAVRKEDRVEGTRADGRAKARLLAVCALLLGLFLMHGGPPAAAGGCHGAMPDALSAAMPIGHTGVDTPPAATPAHAGQHVGTSAGIFVSGMGGTLCVSTPARGGLPLPPPAPLLAVFLFAGLAVFGLTGRPAGLSAGGRRAPPRGGRRLLLQVCVART